MAHTLFVVSHTHWDREWYLPFQQFRSRLVELMDKLLDILARDAGYRHFTLDGQTIILEDYLAVRPERREELQRHVREGRILIGPWYVLPDEFLVSPEALIRNLMLGHRLGQKFGTVMKVGYTPDPFGHISQLPQILRGFGIDTAVLERGVADEGTELRWQAPDGSEVLLVYLRDGYDNAAHLPVTDREAMLERVQGLAESLAPHAATHHLLLLNGTDHMEPQPDLPQALARVSRDLGNCEIIHGTLPAYIRSVQEALRRKPLAKVRGELRCSKRFHLLPGVLSARMYLKQRNHACQTLLEKWAEPFTAFAHLVDPSTSHSQAAIWRSWRHLLQNHPHDSICGCSVDQVHQEMMARFDASEELAESVTRESLRVIAARIDTSSSVPKHEGPRVPIVVFNPLEGPRSDVAEVALQIPGNLKQFVVEDASGQHTPHQIVEEGDKLTLLFLARDVPGHGYKTFFLAPGTEHHRPTGASQLAIENQYYRVEVEPADGTLTVVDKVTGAVYEGLNRFVDGGDSGDEYNYCPPDADSMIASPYGPPEITIVEAGGVRQTLEVRLSYRVPAGLAADRRSRSSHEIEVPITSRISLYPLVPRIDIQTALQNSARDHRLRVHFPTSLQVDTSFAESAFDVVERPIALPADTAAWVEQPVPTHPQLAFAGLSDGQSGLMIANRGLPEYEALSEAGGATIALTLLRCVGWLSRDDLGCRRGPAGPQLETPEAQCPGTYSFDYAMIPHHGDWRHAYQQAHAFSVPLRAVATDQHEGSLPLELSFVEPGPRDLVVSAVKAPEEGQGLIVRFHNMADHEVNAQVGLCTPFRKATLADLNEQDLGQLVIPPHGKVLLPVRGKEIVTVRFEV